MVKRHFISLSTLRSKQNGRRFTPGILKCIFLIESILILIQISLNVRLEINYHWVKVMAWCRQATSHYLSQCCPVLLGLINTYLMQVDQNWSDRVCWTKTTLAVCAPVPHTYGTRSLIVITVAAGALAPVGSMPSTVSMLTNELGMILSKLSLPTSDLNIFCWLHI